jgi:hypothetical protein
VSTKGSTLLLAASLAVNAALVATIALKAPWLFHIGSSDSGQDIPNPLSSPASTGGPAAHAPLPSALPSLLSGDLKTLPERLRAAGFPPNIIRAIVLAQLNDLFVGRRKAVMAEVKINPFWSKSYGNLDPDTLAKFAALWKERTAMQKELLPDLPSDPWNNPYQQNMNGGLPLEKYKRVLAIGSDYNDLKNQIYNAAKGALVPEDNEKLALLEKEQQSDMAAALSPAELLEYQIRNSTTADQMRSSMQAFNPTEDEFRSIFSVQQAFDQQYGANNDTLTPEQRLERQKHQGEVLDQLQGVLGPDRFAEYKQETDPKFLVVNQLMARFDLPVTATRQVVDLEDDITKRAQAIQDDKSLTEGVRANQLSALADEATSKAKSVVGERGFEAYKRTAGSWIQNLKPPGN